MQLYDDCIIMSRMVVTFSAVYCIHVHVHSVGNDLHSKCVTPRTQSLQACMYMYIYLSLMHVHEHTHTHAQLVEVAQKMNSEILESVKETTTVSLNNTYLLYRTSCLVHVYVCTRLDQVHAFSKFKSPK